MPAPAVISGATGSNSPAAEGEKSRQSGLDCRVAPGPARPQRRRHGAVARRSAGAAMAGCIYPDQLRRHDDDQETEARGPEPAEGGSGLRTDPACRSGEGDSRSARRGRFVRDRSGRSELIYRRADRPGFSQKRTVPVLSPDLPPDRPRRRAYRTVAGLGERRSGLDAHRPDAVCPVGIAVTLPTYSTR
jgi:hypothetical protein